MVAWIIVGSFVFKDKNNKFMYLLFGALFLMIIAIIIEVERFKRAHSKEGFIKKIGSIDEKFLEGKISPEGYKELRDKYLEELKKVENKKQK